MERVIAIPDFVDSVMCHMIAYWTSEEPNMDRAWLARKTVTFRFQAEGDELPGAGADWAGAVWASDIVCVPRLEDTGIPSRGQKIRHME
ncbi:MAG: hypothetical protein A2Z99_08465 [Treponema sp. GWB1_62_6]|nr:MAG: hypothetical protein A2Y36_15600 [Treponema sp. GWA1_62_8]OHE66808.1 MAG: hypothetical protein A2Z99_08465 [Treponema sp. GWB1_62_6]